MSVCSWPCTASSMLLESDIRRILAYLIVNQVGFMICAVGVGTVTSINGACAHAFSHIIYKARVVSVGAVIQAAGKTKLSGLVACSDYACDDDLWSGGSGHERFPTDFRLHDQSLITTGTVLYAGTVPDNSLILNCWYVLEAASAAFLFGGMRVVWCVFFGKDSGLRPPDAPLNQKLAMIAFAILSLLVGLMPTPLYEILPNPAAAIELGKHQYGFMHALKLVGLLIFFAVSFVLLLPLLKRNDTITLDADWLYRRGIPWLWRNLLASAAWPWKAADGSHGQGATFRIEHGCRSKWHGQPAGVPRMDGWCRRRADHPDADAVHAVHYVAGS